MSDSAFEPPPGPPPSSFLSYAARNAAVVLLFALSGALALFAAFRLFSRALEARGSLPTIGGWTLVAIATGAGAAGGALAGILTGALRALAALQRAAGDGIQRLPLSATEEKAPAFTLDQVRERRGALVDRIVEATAGRLPLPSFLRRAFRSQLDRALLGDYVAALERRGVRTVGAAELRRWAVERGVATALRPLQAQLRLWRALVLGILGLAAGVALLAGLGL